MTLLTRYFLRLFIPAFFLCLGLFTGVLLMNSFLRLFSLAVAKGISAFWIAACFARLLPYFSGLAIPMAFLVALLLTLGQLAERGEIMALRASGFSFREMTRSFFWTAVLLSALLLYLNHKASPDGYHSFRNRYLAAARQLGTVDLEAGDFVALGPWRLYAKKVDEATGSLEQAYLVRAGTSQSLRVQAAAGRLRLEKGVGATLELQNGTLLLPNPEPRKLTEASFARYRLFVPLSGAPSAPRELDIMELDSGKLWARVHDPATYASRRGEYAVEIAVRSASALSPFVFFWIGAPLGLSLRRGGKGGGFVMSLAVLFVFYGLLTLGMGLGRRDAAWAFSAPWIADAAGLLAGAWLTRKALAQ